MFESPVEDDGVSLFRVEDEGPRPGVPVQMRLRHELGGAVVRRHVDERQKHIERVRLELEGVVNVVAVGVPPLRDAARKCEYDAHVAQARRRAEDGADQRQPRRFAPQRRKVTAVQQRGHDGVDAALVALLKRRKAAGLEVVLLAELRDCINDVIIKIQRRVTRRVHERRAERSGHAADSLLRKLRAPPRRQIFVRLGGLQA
mmetsp:Transcript_19679/g.66562  ORF Transcript_19679/g.66562 Transcript_19679/m.66562 type:complete len:202 (-) Transcript_19679:114-719(-)